MKVAIFVLDAVFEAIAPYVGARRAEAIKQQLNAVYAVQFAEIDKPFEHAQYQSLNHEAW